MTRWFSSVVPQGVAELAAFFDLNPMALVASGLLSGVSASLWRHGFISPGTASIAVFLPLFPLLILSAVTSFFPVKHTLKLLFFIPIGLASAEFAFWVPSGHYANLAGGRDVGAEIEVAVTDVTAAGPRLPWLPTPRLLKCEVLKTRVSRLEPWRGASGTTFVRLPLGSPSPSYGETLVLSGAFVKPEPPVCEGGFDFARYLASKGVVMIFEADAVNPRSTGELRGVRVSLMRCLLNARDFLLSRMTSGMDSDDKRMIAALMFGCRQGVDYRDRRTYLRGGVIHVFAISGLHVGMLAMAVFLFLRWIPFRLRCFIAPLVVGAYVATTGMQPSAARAFLMIGGWSLMRGFLHKTSALNVVFLAAAVILLVDPLSLMGIGFQYSFVIAAFLVLSWRSMERWQLYFRERWLWIPRDALSYRAVFAAKMFDRAFNSLATTIVAWLAGTGLTLLYRSFFIPGAALTNLLVVPVVWMLFSVGALQLLLLPLHSILSMAPIMSSLLSVLKILSLIGADAGGGFHLATPPLWSVFLFLIALAVLVSASRRRVFGVAALGALGIAGFWFLPIFRLPETIVLINGGDGDMPAVVHIPRSNASGATVVNPGSKERCKAVLEYLSSKGVDSIERMLFTANRKPRLGGAYILLAAKNVRHIIFPPGYRRSRFAKIAMDKARATGCFVTIINVDRACGAEEPGATSATRYSSPAFNCVMDDYDAYFAAWSAPFESAEAGVRSNCLGEVAVNAWIGHGNERRKWRRLFWSSNSISFHVLSDKP